MWSFFLNTYPKLQYSIIAKQYFNFSITSITISIVRFLQ